MKTKYILGLGLVLLVAYTIAQIDHRHNLYGGNVTIVINSSNHTEIEKYGETQVGSPCELDEVVCKGEKKDVPRGTITPKSEIHKTIKRISLEMGFEKWQLVVGICHAESNCGQSMSGDNGKSKGYYHIYSPNVCEENGNRKHCISSNDRMDLEKSTIWTIKRLQRHAHLGEFEMIRSHNGLPKSGYNNWYVDWVKENINTHLK